MSTNTEDLYLDYDYSAYDQFRSIQSIRNQEARTWTSLARVVLVVLLRIGFVLVQVGSVPVNNVNLILLENVVDVCWATTVFLLIGFMVAYNGDVGGLVGGGYWIGHAKVDQDEAVTGWTVVVIACAICTSGIAGRTHAVGYLVVAFLLSGLVQPLLIHWAWTPEGWMSDYELGSQRVVYRDFGGSGIVHVAGGLAGLIGCMVLGRRILMLRDIDDAIVAAGSAGTVFAGQLLIFVGLQSLNLPNYDKEKSRIASLSHVCVNNLLASASCCLLVVGLHFALSREEFNHWTVMRCVQAAVSGLVIVSAGTDVYTPLVAIGLGCLGGVVFYFVSRQVFRSALEDYCNIVAIHLTCGVLGSLLAPLCAFDDDTDTQSILLNFCWQLICLLALISLVTIVMTITFLVLKCLGLLRNRSEHLNHLRAMAIEERGPRRSFFQRLFFPDEYSVNVPTETENPEPGPSKSPGLPRIRRGERNERGPL